MKYFIIIEVFILLFICSCKSKGSDEQSNNADIKNIIFPQASSINIDDLIAEWDTIRIEASSRSLLNGVKKLEVANDKLYVLDSSSSLLFIYNKRGEYINKICNQGQGPQEYIKIFDFEVDKSNDRILAVDAFSKRLFIYDSIGNLNKVIPLKFPPFHISSDSSKRLIHLCSTAKDFQFDELNNNNVAVINEKGGIEKTFLKDETPERLDLIPLLSNNLSEEGDLLYMPVFSNVIYRIHNEKAIPEYILQNKTGKKNLTSKEKQNLFYTYEGNNVDGYEKKGYFLPLGNFLTDENWLMIESGWEEKLRTFYNKRERKSISINTQSLKGDKGLREILMTYPHSLENGWFYACISSDLRFYLLEILSDGKVKTFLESTVEDDNPSLIRYKLNSEIFKNM